MSARTNAGSPTGTALIDLRSDTVTRPDAGMLAAMTVAEVGDDVYHEDPTVNSLQERVAALLGKQAALFTVTGSMANMLAVRGLVAPGQEVLCESRAHIARAEMGAHAALFGVTMRTWSHPRGLIEASSIASMATPNAGPHFVSTAAVSVENTHNFGGGSVQLPADVAALGEFAAEQGIGLHLDGARIWNASVACGLPVRELVAPFDVVSVCLSKGLGAPVGSLLAGSAEAIEQAWMWRKRLGGGWRQAGLLAAAGHYALDHNLERLADTHADAQVIAVACADALPGCVDPAQVQTNIVVLDLAAAHRSAAEVVAAAAARGVRVSATGPAAVRVVTHIDVTSAQARTAAGALAQLLRG